MQTKTRREQGQYTAPLVDVVSQKLNGETGYWILNLSCGHTARISGRARGYIQIRHHYCIACSPEYKTVVASIQAKRPA